MFWVQLHHEAQAEGLILECSGGCERGQAGDMTMIGPPFIVTRAEIDEIAARLERVIGALEKRVGL